MRKLASPSHIIKLETKGDAILARKKGTSSKASQRRSLLWVRTRLGVLKPKKLIDAIKKAKSRAGGASGACKARICKKCGKGSRAAVHVEGRCRFMV